MNRRILSLFLSVVLLLSLLPVGVFAAWVVDSGTCGAEGDGSNLTWTLDSDGLLTISGTGSMTSYTFSSSKSPFYYCADIKSVVVECGVTGIGDYAFYNCRNLTSVTLPDSVTRIGNDAFYNCNGLTSITIPGSVTSIGDYAFSSCGSLTSITIPSSVVSISDYTFYGCDGLTSATIPDSVTSIGQFAFSDCDSLTSVTIPDSVTSIGQFAFSYCGSLTSVTIPDSVTSIGRFAFYDCDSLTSVTIPNSVSSIGDSAFADCHALTDITVAPENKDFSSDAFGVLFNKNKTMLLQCPGSYEGAYSIPDSVTIIGNYAFSDCTNLTSVSVPDSVTSIGDDAFSDCTGLTSVSVPDSVTSIGIGAFSDCTGLTSVSVPDSVTSIGSGAFSYCSGLTSIAIPNSGIKLGAMAFYSCTGLTSILIPGTVYGPYSRTFSGCTGLVSAVISDGITEINSEDFSGCTSLIKIYIPSTVLTVGMAAFNDCISLADVYYSGTESEWSNIDICTDSIDFPPDWEESDGVSGNDALTKAEIHYNHRHSYTDGMCVCGATGTACEHNWVASTAVPASCTDDGYTPHTCSLCGAIENRSMIPAIGHDLIADAAIPATCTNAGRTAGTHCSRCDYTTYAEMPATGHSFIDREEAIPATCTEKGEKTCTCTACGWVDVIEIAALGHDFVNGRCTRCDEEAPVVIIDSGTCGKNVTWALDSNGLLTISGIGAMDDYDSYSKISPFYCRTDIQTVVVSHGVTSIGSYAFIGCSCLASIRIPDSVTSIGYVAFSNCTSLTGITIPDSVTDIGCAAFNVCGSLTSITIPDSISEISENLFYDCAALTSITIPDSVTRIGEFAFGGCTSLTEISLPDSITHLGQSILIGCTSLTSVTLPRSITYIPNEMFYRCRALTSITLPDGLTSIDNAAFYGCSSLTGITLPDSVTRIGELAFYGCTVLTGITLPDSLTSIGYSAFNNCTSLTSITLLNSVTHIGGSAFEGCSSLTSITLPDSVTSIGSYAFHGCSALTNITVVPENEYYSSDAFGVLYNKNKTVLIQCPGGFEGAYTIPNGVTSIGEGAFWDCSRLTSITLPDSVTSIGYSAFRGCSSLTDITLPDGVTSIGNYAFWDCSRLTNITLPDSVTSIGYSAFRGCSSLANVYYMGSEAQWNAITVGNYNEPLTNAIIHFNHVHEYVDGACVCGALGTGCEHSWVAGASVAASCTEDGCIIYTCSVCEEVKTDILPALGHDVVVEAGIPATCTKAGRTEGRQCKRCGEILAVPQEILALGHRNEIMPAVPATCTEAGLTEGIRCALCKEVFVAQQFTSALWHNYQNDICIRCKEHDPTKDSTVVDYGSCGNQAIWIFDTEGCLRILGVGAMTDYQYRDRNTPYDAYRESITSIVVSHGITHIGDGAFGDCDKAATVSISSSVRTVGEAAFYGCSSLTAIEVDTDNSHLYDIDGLLYRRSDATLIACPGTKTGSLFIPESTLGIGQNAFYDCKYLRSISIPASVSSVHPKAFLGCAALTSFSVSAQSPHYCDINGVLFNRAADTLCTFPNALGGSYQIPDGVTGISDYAFFGCDQLSRLSVPADVTDIGANAFSGCARLCVVYYRGAKAHWDAINVKSGNKNLLQSKVHYDFTNEVEHFSIGAPVPPTCTTGGYTPITCPCGYEEKQNTVSALGHSWDDGVVSTEPTATTPGVKLFTCGICGAVKTSVIPTDETHEAELEQHTLCDQIYWTLDRYGILTIFGTGTIPDFSQTGSPFYGRTDISCVVIKSGITGIGAYTFCKCTTVRSITISDTVTQIGSHSFERCNGLTSIIIPEGVTSIEDGAFQNCEKLVNVYFGGTAPLIGRNVFTMQTQLGTTYTNPELVLYYRSGMRGWFRPRWNGYRTELWDQHMHSYKDSLVPSTCERYGYTLHQCACGRSYKDSYLPKTAHTWIFLGICSVCKKTKLQVSIEEGPSLDDLIIEIINQMVNTHTDLAELSLSQTDSARVNIARAASVIADATVPTQSGGSAPANIELTVPTKDATVTFNNQAVHEIADAGENAVLQVDAVAQAEAVSPDAVAAYDVHLTCDGKPIAFDAGGDTSGTATISVPVPENAANPLVYYVNQGRQELMPSWISGDRIFFVTTHFSTFAVMGHTHELSELFNNGDGTHTVMCASCTYKQTVPHIYESGICACGALEADEPVHDSTLSFAQASLTLHSDISISFYVDSSILDGATAPYVVFTKEVYDYEGTTSSIETTTVSSFTSVTAADDTVYRVFTFDGINPSEMGSEVTATLYAEKDGELCAGQPFAYSVQTYALNMLHNTQDAKLKPLLVDLLNYGAATQVYAGYNTQHPVNAALTPSELAFATAATPELHNSTALTNAEDATVRMISATLLLAEKISMTFFLNLAGYAGEVSDLEARVSYAGPSGSTVTRTVDGTDFTALLKNGKESLAVTVDFLDASQLRTVCTVEIFSKTTGRAVSGQVSYSVESYAANKLADTNSALAYLVEAMMKYGDAVSAYFAD